MILVTGGTGMLGSYLLYHLTLNNNFIFALKRKNSSIRNCYSVFLNLNPEKAQLLFDRIQWIEGSLFDLPFLEELIPKCTEIYHCAAKITFNESKEKEIFKVNLNATTNLLNFSINKIQKFCYISSIFALPIQSEFEKIDEKSEFTSKKDYCSYGLSKYAAELEVFRASQEGLNVVIVNPGVIVGSFHWNRKSDVLFHLNNKKRAFSTSGNSFLIDVEDVVKSCIELMNQNIFGEKFILVSNPISYKEQTNLIRKILNKRPSVSIKKSTLKLIFLFLNPLKLIFKSLERKFDTKKLNVLTSKKIISNQKIKNILGIQFLSAEQTLIKHTQNFKNYLDESNVEIYRNSKK